jgi:hypothetical protein
MICTACIMNISILRRGTSAPLTHAGVRAADERAGLHDAHLRDDVTFKRVEPTFVQIVICAASPTTMLYDW